MLLTIAFKKTSFDFINVSHEETEVSTIAKVLKLSSFCDHVKLAWITIFTHYKFIREKKEKYENRGGKGRGRGVKKRMKDIRLRLSFVKSNVCNKLMKDNMCLVQVINFRN